MKEQNLSQSDSVQPNGVASLWPQITAAGKERFVRGIVLLLPFMMLMLIAVPGRASAAAGQPGGDVTLEVISAWGGPVNTIDIQGNLAYIGSGRRMVILDITDLLNITEVGSIDLLSTIEDLVVRDDYAYVGTQHEIFGWGFGSVNISDPANPTLGSNPDAFGNFKSGHVELYGNIAYVGPGGGFGSPMRAYDITDPENIIGVGGDIIVNHNSFTIKGDLLYTTNKGHDAELAIYDLSKGPLNLTLLGELVLPADPFLNVEALHVAVEGNLASLIIEDNNEHFFFLAVVDVSNPMSPMLLGTYDFPNGSTGVSRHPNSLVFSDGLAYVAGADGEINDGLFDGLFIFDVATDPLNPTLVGTFYTHASVYGVKKSSGTTAYVFDAGVGLIILDVSDPAKPERLGGYHSPTDLRKMKKIGDLLYVSDYWHGFTVLNVSDPHSTPTVVGIYQTSESVTNIDYTGNWGLDVRDGLAYLSEGLRGFEVVDVSNPANPVFAGAVKPWPDNVRAMDLKLNPVTEPPFTDILHVGTESGAWLVNFDVSDLSNITEIGSAWLGGGQTTVHDIAVTPDGQYAHVAISMPPGAWAVQVVDVSDPTAPQVINRDLLGGNSIDIALDGDIRYIASSDDLGCDTEGDLHIQDISDPTNPIDLSIVDWCYGDLGIHRVGAVAVFNDRAYVTALFSPPDTPAASAFVVAFDVTDPSAPVPLDWVKAGSANRKTAMLGDDPYLFVTTRTGPVRSEGLVIIEIVVAGTCPWDLDSNGSIGVKDLLFLLGAWGPCPKQGDCPADFDDSGDIGVKDLLTLLGAWGACP